jgi:hypothetical protein
MPIFESSRLNRNSKIELHCFALISLDRNDLRQTEEGQNTATRNYPTLGRKESGIARDEAGGDALGRVGRVRGVSAQGRVCGSGGEALPFVLTSPNAIDPVQTFTAFLISVSTGARRFAHPGWLRTDTALRRVLGMVRFPSDDTLRSVFR